MGDVVEAVLDEPPVELPPGTQPGRGPATVAVEAAVDPAGVGAAGAEPSSLVQRATAARAAGAELQACWAAGQRTPPAPKPQAPLRARAWVATGGRAELPGIYGTWAGGAQRAAQGSPACHVVGFASLAEAVAFAEGVGGHIPDRRR